MNNDQQRTALHSGSLWRHPDFLTSSHIRKAFYKTQAHQKSISRRRMLRDLITVSGLAFSGDLLLAACENQPATASLADDPFAARMGDRTVAIYRGHTALVRSIIWSRDGARIATEGDDQTVQVWEALTGRHLQTFKRQFFRTLTWAPDGTRFACCVTDGQTSGGDPHLAVLVWDASTGKALWSFSQPSLFTNNPQWSPDGKYLAFNTGSISQNVTTSSLEIYETTTWKHIQTFDLPFDAVRNVAWSFDSQHIAIGGDFDRLTDAELQARESLMFQVWNASTGKQLFTKPYSDVYSLAWSPDGKYILIDSVSVTDGNARIIDASNGRILASYPRPTPLFGPVAWSPSNGKRIAIAINKEEQGAIEIWKPLTQELLYVYTAQGQLGAIEDMAWSPDGKYIAASSSKVVGKDKKGDLVYENIVRVWSAA